MIQKKKPISRLTLLFISIVVVSGSILAYLSIHNITNLKELTEKRIQEDQISYAAGISDQLHQEVITLIDSFSAYCKNDPEILLDHRRSRKPSDLMKQIFVMDRDGHFLWPWFTSETPHRPDHSSSERYDRMFSRGERAEFAEQDFQISSQYYLSALRESLNGTDSVKVLNSLARLSVKLEDGKQALSYYSDIINTYYAYCDPYGFPYVYYALPQLIRIYSDDNNPVIIREITRCIHGMETGSILLNYSTQNLLQQVLEWLQTVPVSSGEGANISASIQHISNNLSFIERNRERIHDYIMEESQGESSDQINGYQVQSGNLNDHPEIIVLNSGKGLAYGFTLVLEELWNTMSEKGFTEDSEFDYEVSLVKTGRSAVSTEDGLTTSLDIDPYFDNYLMVVKLQHEGLINELVRRRSWIFGITLILLLGGMILGVLLILRDISREKHLARIRANFVSNVTHELKTPLTSIQLLTESILLARIRTAVHRNEYLHIILKEVESLKRMINNILDFSRMEMGKREYKFKQVNMTSLLNEVINDLEYWLKEKKFTLVKEIEDDVIVTADPAAFKQAILNLLNNAIKFSIKRREIYIGLGKDHETVSLRITDKGIGIPETQHELIFKAFYRVKQEHTEDISGTGLGLSVVKDIVEAHQGKILIDSKLNQGSTFTIELKSKYENPE